MSDNATPSLSKYLTTRFSQRDDTTADVLCDEILGWGIGGHKCDLPQGHDGPHRCECRRWLP